MLPRTIKTVAVFNASQNTIELADSIAWCLREINCAIVYHLDLDRDDILYIIVCPAGIYYTSETKLPMYYITYQLETYNSLRKPEYKPILEKALFNWDFSEYNCESDLAKELNLIHVPIGWTPNMSKKHLEYRDHKKPIDVLFLGYCGASPRRQFIKKELTNLGLNICFESNARLPQMQELILKSKVCIDIRQQEFITDPAMIRYNLYLSNMACIIAEEVPNLDAMELYQKGGVVFVKYSRLTETILKYVKDFELRFSAAIKSNIWYTEKRRWNRIYNFDPFMGMLHK